MEINDLIGLGQLSESALNSMGKSLSPLLKPVFEELGQAFSDPVRRIRFEREIQWYKRLEKAGLYIEESGKKIHPINPKILLPIAESASLEDDSYLQDLWSRLLASALTDGGLHPGFPEVLKQLTPLDAKVLNLIGKKAGDRLTHNEFTIFLELAKHFGAGELARKISENRGTSELDFTTDDEALLIEKHALIQESLDNLQRLSLIKTIEYTNPLQNAYGTIVIPWGATNIEHSSFGIRFLCCITGPNQIRPEK
jgi:hypothetical protein